MFNLDDYSVQFCHRACGKTACRFFSVVVSLRHACKISSARNLRLRMLALFVDSGNREIHSRGIAFWKQESEAGSGHHRCLVESIKKPHQKIDEAIVTHLQDRSTVHFAYPIGVTPERGFFSVMRLVAAKHTVLCQQKKYTRSAKNTQFRHGFWRFWVWIRSSVLSTNNCSFIQCLSIISQYAMC